MGACSGIPFAAITPATSAPQQDDQPGYEKYPLPHRPVHILDEQT
jgi:hypothetical protein